MTPVVVPARDQDPPVRQQRGCGTIRERGIFPVDGQFWAWRGRAASTQLAALRNWLDMHGNEVIIIVCLVLGVWLTGQSIRLLAIAGGT